MRSSGPESADSRDWAKAITRQVAAGRKRGIVRAVALGASESGGVAPIGAVVNTSRRRCRIARRVVVSVSRAAKRSGRGPRGT
jgi:hypothetical protein